MKELDPEQRAKLDKLQRSIAEEEPKLTAAIEEYNATVRAAYEKLLGLTAGYERARDEFEALHAEVGQAMAEAAGEPGDDWQAGDEGGAYLEWVAAWHEPAVITSPLERPRELRLPEPRLSDVIVALPVKPVEDADPTEDAALMQDAAIAPRAPETPIPSTSPGVVVRRFEFTGGTSSKYWEISLDGAEMMTRWGRIGTDGQSKAKTFETPEKAAAESAKAIARKLKEGYVDMVTPGAVVARGQSSSSSPGSTAWTESVDPESMFGVVLPTASDRKRRLFAVACCRRVLDWMLGIYEGVGLDERLQHYRDAVTAAERFADGRVTAGELRDAFFGADDACFINDPDGVKDATMQELRKAAFGDDPAWFGRLPYLEDEDREEIMARYNDPAAWVEASKDARDHIDETFDPFRDVAGEDAVEVGETIGRQVLLQTRKYGGRKREAVERAAQASLVREVFGDPYPPPTFDPAWRTPEVTAIATNIYEDGEFDRLPILAAALESAGCGDAAIIGHCRGQGPHERGCWVLDMVIGRE